VGGRRWRGGLRGLWGICEGGGGGLVGVALMVVWLGYIA